MIRRRQQFNALAATAAPRWLVSRTMQHTVIEARRIEPGCDLVRAFLTAMLELLDAGWSIGDFSSSAALVRCSRGAEQRILCIEHIDPRQVHAAPKWDGQGIG